MSNSSLTQVRYLKEVSWGVTPSAAMTNLNVTSESLGQNTNQVRSEYLRADRQDADVTRTSITAGGDVGIELQYGGYDALLEGLLMAAFATAVNITGTTFSAAQSDNSFNDSGNGFVSGNIIVNQWIRVSGFTTAANNGYFKVSSVVAGKVVVTGGTLVDEVAGDTVTIKGSMLKQGTTRTSFTFEKEYPDITEFVAFTGMKVGQMNLTISPGSIINGSFSLMGKQALASGATVGTGAANAASTNPVMNAVDNVRSIREGGAAATFDITSLQLTVNNSLRDQAAVGSLANVGIGEGTIQVNGTMECYFADRTEYEKYLNNTVSSLSFLCIDDLGNGYMIDLPKLKYSGGNPQAGGKDQDVLVSLQFTAYRHATEGNTITITKFPV